MIQILFIIGCLLVPAFSDWTARCRMNEAGRDERGRGTDEGHGGE